MSCSSAVQSLDSKGTEEEFVLDSLAACSRQVPSDLVGCVLDVQGDVATDLHSKKEILASARVRLGSAKNRFVVLVLGTQRSFPCSSIMSSLGLVLRLEHCVETVIVKFKVASPGQRSEKQ